jgi:hypothetical protein
MTCVGESRVECCATRRCMCCATRPRQASHGPPSGVARVARRLHPSSIAQSLRSASGAAGKSVSHGCPSHRGPTDPSYSGITTAAVTQANGQRTAFSTTFSCSLAPRPLSDRQVHGIMMWQSRGRIQQNFCQYLQTQFNEKQQAQSGIDVSRASPKHPKLCARPQSRRTAVACPAIAADHPSIQNPSTQTSPPGSQRSAKGRHSGHHATATHSVGPFRHEEPSLSPSFRHDEHRHRIMLAYISQSFHPRRHAATTGRRASRP